jgi:hypothetical protein
VGRWDNPNWVITVDHQVKGPAFVADPKFGSLCPQSRALLGIAIERAKG